MDYLFNFRKVPNLQTVRNDYPRTYRVLRSVSAIPQQAGDPRSTNEEDDTIDVIIRQDNVPRDLLLELQGLKALLKQKAAAIEAASSSSSSSSGSGGEEVSDAAVDQLGDVHAHVAAVEAVISKTKVLRAVLQSSTKKHASSITSDASADQLRLLRERAVKYRMFFDELRQNREDVGASMHRYEPRSHDPSCQRHPHSPHAPSFALLQIRRRTRAAAGVVRAAQRLARSRAVAAKW
jgi:hypothetical protein